MQIYEDSRTYDIQTKEYDIHPEDYNKRLKAWKQLTIDIIADYDKILVELEQAIKHNMIMKVSDHNTKILTTTRARDRIFRDFVKLSSGNHNMHKEFKMVYESFTNKMDIIEGRFQEITSIPSLDICIPHRSTAYYSKSHGTKNMANVIA